MEDQIKAYRLSKGMSQQELAEKINITQAMLSQYESGKRPISNAMLEKLVSKGVVDVNELSTSKALMIKMELLKREDFKMVEALIQRMGR
jgi:transcriptional regulator with XRE-family HTH domain